MSATGDPDRIFRAWLEQMPSEAPDRAIAAVIQATAAAPQVRAWPALGRWRPSQMNRLSLIAATAALAIALVGGAILLTSGRPGPTVPTPAASASPTPSPTAAIALTPEVLIGTWVAAPSSGVPGETMEMNLAGSLITVADSGAVTVVSRPAPGPADELTIRASDSTHDCRADDLGRYRFAFRPDGTLPDSDDTLLTLTAVQDACPARQAILERTWVRSYSAQFTGGRFVAPQFSPMFMVTVPTLAYRPTFDQRDVLMAEPPAEPWGAFVATRNPWGFTEPCSDTGGAKLPVDATIDAFVAYLDSIPGFTVERSPVKLGDVDAVRLVILSTKTPDCQNRGANSGRVVEWTNSDPFFNGNFVLSQGDTDVMYLVEVDGALFVFQWLANGVTQQQELAVLSTIRFIDELPS